MDWYCNVFNINIDNDMFKKHVDIYGDIIENYIQIEPRINF